jgi:bacteriocin biosynthesis cyclodehydratase domain-containing protein
MSQKNDDLGLSFLKEKGTNFPERPRLVDDLAIISMPDGVGVQVRGLVNPVLMRGALVETLLPSVLPLLDGTHDFGELLRLLPSTTKEKDLAILLMNLFTRGLICSQSETVETTGDLVKHKQMLFLGRRLGVTRYNRSAGEAMEKLSKTSLLVVADGLLGIVCCDLLNRSGFEHISVSVHNSDSETEAAYKELSETLVAGKTSMSFVERNAKAVGSKLLQSLPSTDLIIVAVRNSPDSIFTTVNEICINGSVQWLRAYDTGSQIEVGPYINPHDSPCYECMAIRKVSTSEHAVEEELYQRALEDGSGAAGLSGESLSLASLAASYLVQEVIRVATGIEPPMLAGRVTSFYSDGNIDQNTFTRVPRCEACCRGASYVLVEKAKANKSG